MNKKNTLKKAAALALGFALTVGAAGCDFVVTDNEEDLKQTIATVNISKELENDSLYGEYADDVKSVVDNLSKDISKRDLVAYFLSVGYQYVESYGYTYEDTFNMLLDGLISREIMIQYAIAYYLKNNGDTVSAAACDEYVNSHLPTDADKERKELLRSVLTLQYFLSEGKPEENTEEYDRAAYTLKKSLNDSLDSIEGQYVKTEDEEHHHGEGQTVPTGVNEEVEDYYAAKYEVYTGRNTLDSCPNYEKIEGSTTATRQKAYNAFLMNLHDYGMVGNEGKVEDTRSITNLNYYYVELSSALGQALITKYFEDLENSVMQELTEEYVQKKYTELYEQQKTLYENDPDAFATALESASADSFILYGLDNFGFVYNILLPFSTSQTEAYTREQNRGLTQDEEFNFRKRLLENVKGEDQRGAWIDEHDHANYGYEKDGKYYFFENNVTNTAKYKELTHYAGVLPYNGTVDEDMKATPTPVTLSEVLTTLKNTIKEVSGLDMTMQEVAEYQAGKYDTVYTTDNEVDYSKFIAYKGKVNFTQEPSSSDFFNKNSEVYKMVAAVNEVMFAYSTDTGCLNKYMGYSVSPYGTNFMKEFEKAAQVAVEEGVGTITVAPTDYGWHIIISAFTYTKDGEVYTYKHSEAVGENKVEGSFSNLFYESLKETAASNHSNEEQSRVLNDYNNDACVKRYQDRYQDLLDME